MGWHRELMIGFDLETTGTDPHEARIVTGAVIEAGAGGTTGRREWLADPGVPVSTEAVAVRGISNGRAAAECRSADQVAAALAGVLTTDWAMGVPTVACKAAFCARTSATSRVSHPVASRRVPVRAGAGAAR